MQNETWYKFTDTLKKNIEVISVYKKDDVIDKRNYCPVSAMSNLSKVFEKLMYCQIYT